MIEDEDDLDLEAMEAEIYEQEQAEESLEAEFACCDCGFINDARDGHHPEIRCPESGRCGQCGNAWPCAEHLHLAPKSVPKHGVAFKSTWTPKKTATTMKMEKRKSNEKTSEKSKARVGGRK